GDDAPRLHPGEETEAEGATAVVDRETRRRAAGAGREDETFGDGEAGRARVDISRAPGPRVHQPESGRVDASRPIVLARDREHAAAQPARGARGAVRLLRRDGWLAERVRGDRERPQVDLGDGRPADDEHAAGGLVDREPGLLPCDVVAGAELLRPGVDRPERREANGAPGTH